MDIVEQLRNFAAAYTTTIHHDALVSEAADVIERLRSCPDNPALTREIIEQQTEIERLRDEVAALKQTLGMSVQRHLYDEVCAEVDALREVLAAAENLVRVKGRHHSEMAYSRLVSAVADLKQSFTSNPEQHPNDCRTNQPSP